MLSRLVAHPCLRSLGSLRHCGDFLPAEGTMICCHLVPIPCGLEFLLDIFWVRLSLLQLCSLQVSLLEIGHRWDWFVLWRLLLHVLWQQHIPGERLAGWGQSRCWGLLCKGENLHLFSFSFQNDRGGIPQGGVHDVSFLWVLALDGVCIGPSNCFPPLLDIVIRQCLRGCFWLASHSASEMF